MLTTCDLIAFASATDLPRAQNFYEHTLGLRLLEHNDFACVLDANGTMLRITQATAVAHPGYTVLGWQVVDIHEAVTALVEKDVTMLRYDGMSQDESGVWTTPGGDSVAWFEDPDGNVLSLTQFS